MKSVKLTRKLSVYAPLIMLAGCGLIRDSKSPVCSDGRVCPYDQKCTIEPPITCIKGSCGDGQVQDGEECDPGGTEPSEACNRDCTLSRCGDGKVNPKDKNHEECDGDGKGVGGETPECNGNCHPNRCGDGWVNTKAGEECDEGDDKNSDTGYCTKSCKRARCGDGITQSGEDCDEGDDKNSNTGTCTKDCKKPRCGDGYVQGTEKCDFADPAVSPAGNPAVPEGHHCNSDCNWNVCGDGTTNAADNEQCDSGGESSFCNSNCTTAKHGDGIVNHAFDEQCDGDGAGHGNDQNCQGTKCNIDCTPSVHGDGKVNSMDNEECDDGSKNDTPCGYGEMICKRCHCDTSGCKVTSPPHGDYCGDGTKNGPEICDGASIQCGTCINNCTATAPAKAATGSITVVEPPAGSTAKNQIKDGSIFDLPDGTDKVTFQLYLDTSPKPALPIVGVNFKLTDSPAEVAGQIWDAITGKSVQQAPSPKLLSVTVTLTDSTVNLTTINGRIGNQEIKKSDNAQGFTVKGFEEGNGCGLGAGCAAPGDCVSPLVCNLDSSNPSCVRQ